MVLVDKWEEISVIDSGPNTKIWLKKKGILAVKIFDNVWLFTIELKV